MRRSTRLGLVAASALLVACGGGDSDGSSGGNSDSGAAAPSGATAERATIVSEMTAWIQTLDVEIADPAALQTCVEGYVAELSDDDAVIIAANVAAEYAGLENGEITDWEALGVSEDGRYSYAGALLCR